MLCAACGGGDSPGTGGSSPSTGSATTSAGGNGATSTTASTGAAASTSSTAGAGGSGGASATSTTTGATTSTASTGAGGSAAVCGNGTKDPGEECDLGAANSDTGVCTKQCKNAVCGDGLVAPNEGCDLGAMNSDMGACTSACKSASCGDALVETAVEECDLGQASNVDTGACTTMCKAAKCGDAFVHAGVEECDLGQANNSNTGACTVACKSAKCGDSFVQAGVEECDLGAQNANTAACTASCKSAKCGDSFVQAGVEECDLGAQNANTAACTASCKNAKCGDSFVQAGEACDDGNVVNGDGCNNDCVVSGTPLSTTTYTSPSGNSNWNGIVIDAAGNIIVAGAEPTAAQGFDAVVIKYDAAGNVLWKQTFNDTSSNLDDVAYAVTADSAGNIIVAGSSEDTASGKDLWIRKYSAAGAVQWTKFYDGGEQLDDTAFGVAVDTLGNIFITGSINAVAEQGTDIAVAKLSGLNGSILWADIIDNANGVAGGNDFGFGVAVRTIAGATQIAVTGFTAASDTQLDGWTRKYTDGPTPTPMWTQIYTGTSGGNDFGQSVALDAAGNVIVAGGEEVVNQGFNTWIRKYGSALGATTWTSTYNKAGVNLDDAAVGINLDASGNVLVTGYETAANGHSDAWTEKLTSGGTVLWTRTFNGPASSDDGGAGVTADANGNVYVAGYVAMSANNSTAWLEKYAP